MINVVSDDSRSRSSHSPVDEAATQRCARILPFIFPSRWPAEEASETGGTAAKSYANWILSKGSTSPSVSSTTEKYIPKMKVPASIGRPWPERPCRLCGQRIANLTNHLMVHLPQKRRYSCSDPACYFLTNSPTLAAEHEHPMVDGIRRFAEELDLMDRRCFPDD